jgi:nickel-type superoxide dismutase maturation protease
VADLRRTLLAWLPVRRFRVEETSMQPTLRPGDRVLVATWLRPRPGDVVLLRDPQQHSQFLAKRVAQRLGSGELIVAGDNPNVSRDSREFGAVPPTLVIGRVVFRYLPAQRRGRV